MSNQEMDKQKMVAQIEEAAKRYNEIVENTDNEIAKIKQQLLDSGVPGSIVVKLKPSWHNDVSFLLRKEIENLNNELMRKAG
jgi:hypothetical protein